LKKKIKSLQDGLKTERGEVVIWSFLDKGIRMLLGIIAYVFIARELGPNNYGLLALALSTQAILMALVTLGADQVLIRNLAIGGSYGHEFLSATVFLRTIICISLLCISIFFVIAWPDYPIDLAFWIIVATTVYMPLFTIESILQSENAFKFVIQVKLVVFVFALAARLLVVHFFKDKALVALAVIINLEFLLSYCIMLWIRGKRLPKDLRFPALKTLKSIIKECLPLLVSSIVVVIYMRVDQLMLGAYADSKQVGIFAAAVKLIEIFYFIPMTVFVVLLPDMSRLFRDSINIYNEKIDILISMSGFLSTVLAMIVGLVSYFLMPILLGVNYQGAGVVSLCYSMTLIFVFLGVVRAFHYTILGENKLLMFYNLIGLCVNVSLNMLLIPNYGALGAAVSTVIGQAVGSCFSSYFFRTSRMFGQRQLKSILLVFSPVDSMKMLLLKSNGLLKYN
jgi:polysaccharide transporter, PST family